MFQRIFSVSRPHATGMLLLAALVVIAVTSHGAEFRQGDHVTVTGRFSDNLFVAGGQIDGPFESSDDVFFAGNQVTFQGRTTESLYLAGFDVFVTNGAAQNAVIAGANVRIAQTQLRELILFAGNVTVIDTEIGDDLILSGGDIQIGERTTVRDSVTVAGGDIVFRGAAGGDARFVGERVVLAGTFAGNVDVSASDLVVAPGTTISGDLTHRTGDVDISPDAQIAGTVRAFPLERERDTPGVIGYVWGVLAVIGFLLVPAILALFAPRLMEHGDQIFRSDFWESLGKGTAGAILIPLALVLLLAIGIGATLALVAMPFLATLWIMAGVLGAYIVGAWVARQLKLRAMSVKGGRSRRAAVFWQTLLGTVILVVISWIPVLGAIFAVILALASFGALLIRAQRGTTETTGEVSTADKTAA